MFNPDMTPTQNLLFLMNRNVQHSRLRMFMVCQFPEVWIRQVQVHHDCTPPQNVERQVQVIWGVEQLRRLSNVLEWIEEEEM